MKPFDIEAAKRGEPVVTRDGYPVLILRVDLKNDYPIVGTIIIDDYERVEQWDETGAYFCKSLDMDETSRVFDLFMAPRKREYWVNVYKFSDGSVRTSPKPLQSEADAKAAAVGSVDYLKTIKIHEQEI